MKNQLRDYFSLTTTLIKLRETFEVGSLNQICRIVQQDTTLFEGNNLQNCFVQFLTAVGDYSRKNQSSKAQSLALIVLQSITFNLYARNKKTDKMKLNNSFYRSMSMSMSQMSMELSQQSILAPQDLKKLTSFIQALSGNKKFFKRLSLIGQRHHNKSRNQKYLQNFMETMQYIMNKQKMNKDNYYEAKKSFSATVISKQQIKDNWQTVNEIIFSNKLNRIAFMLTDAPDQVHFALNRIYFIGKKNEERRHFRLNKYNSYDMTYNLYKLYITSFPNKVDIFQQGKHPIYRFISSYLQCFFMPQFLKFNQIILKASKHQFETTHQFYRNTEPTLIKQLTSFIEQLPSELLQFLNVLYKIIQFNFKLSLTGNSCLPVKKLLIYSFLVQTDFIEEIFEQTSDLDRYEDACNYIVSLFFPSSIKNFTEQISSYIQKLIEKVSNKMDERIMNPLSDRFDEENGVSSYFLEQPILNHDYQIVALWIKQLQFTPKDLKQFTMAKQTQLTHFSNQQTKSSILESPMMKQIKKDLQQISDNEEQQQQQSSTDLLTYMTVGGTHNWRLQSEENQKKKRDSQKPKQKKMKFESFRKDKLTQIANLYQKFQDIELNLK